MKLDHWIRLRQGYAEGHHESFVFYPSIRRSLIEIDMHESRGSRALVVVENPKTEVDKTAKGDEVVKNEEGSLDSDSKESKVLGDKGKSKETKKSQRRRKAKGRERTTKGNNKVKKEQ